MSRVLLEMSISLDGYVTGPDVSDEEPLGRGGEALHEWMFAGRAPDEAREWLTQQFSGIGAVIMGRRMVDLGIRFWGEEPVFHAPCFVVTHRPAETIEKAGGGARLFDGVRTDLTLVPSAAAAAPLVTHLTYRVE